MVVQIPLSLVVVASNRSSYFGWDVDPFPPLSELTLWTNDLQGRPYPLSKIGNLILDRQVGTVIGICHADTSFGPGALETFAEAALDGSVVGIVGVDLQRVYHWSKDNPGQVSTLDSCSVFFRRDLGLRFDEQTFDGLHCHVEDLCLQAQAKRIPVIVPAAQASHIGQSTDNPQWQGDYAKYRARLAMKWRGVRFETT